MGFPVRNDKAAPVASGGSDETDRDAYYRHHVANVILRHVTKDGNREPAEAYRRVMAVTGRALGTVKNWLTYRTNFPDMASVARIVDRFSIPPEDFYPAHLQQLLSGVPEEAPSEGGLAGGEPPVLSPYRPGDPATVDRALSKYTDHPRSAVFYRQSGSDMLDQIRPGELMLVDPTCEQISGSGMYLLRFSPEGQAETTVVRMVDVLMGEPAVRLSCGSAMPPSSVETIPLVKGGLPPHITVLARVVGVLRQL